MTECSLHWPSARVPRSYIHAVTGGNAADGAPFAAGVRKQRRADRRWRSVFRHVRLQRLEGATDVQLLPDPPRQRLSDLGHGQSVGTTPTAPKKSLVDLLTQLELTPGQIKYVAVSHYHGDHVGQVSSFPQSTLLIGKGDWDVLTDPKSAAVANPAPFANWISGGGKVEPLAGDRDVFGDSTVVVLNTPGHTPGHHSLLVKLKEMGNVLITGDLAHFHENYEMNGVPTFNTDRAATLASLDVSRSSPRT